jgi:LysR family glycine cleavage system transcriptional activator
MMQAAAEGQGIALGRATLMGNDERNGLLVRPFAIEAPAPRRFYLVYPPRNADSPKLAAFRAWLHAEIAADRKPGASRRAPARQRPAPKSRAADRGHEQR